MSAKDSIQNSIKMRREQSGWSQAELAEQAGMSRSEVSAIEIGRVVPSALAALRLAQAFRCSVENLFSIRARTNAPQLAWAWEAKSGITPRSWRATVSGLERLYPAEYLSTGTVATDEALDGGAHLPTNTLVIAACDPAVGLLTREIERMGFRCLAFVRSSRKALQLLAEGKVHAAGIHLGESTAENQRIASSILGPGFSLVRVAIWEEGVSSAQALSVTSPRALRQLRWVGREPGSGARRCSDALLENPQQLPVGYDRLVPDHRGVAESIRAGWADVGVCVRLAAEEAGLKFQCVTREAYDLCFRSDSADDLRVQALIRRLQSIEYKNAVAALPGYDSASCGEVTTIL